MYLHKCPSCGARNRIVNECRCDPNNLPTVAGVPLPLQPKARLYRESSTVAEAPDLYLSPQSFRRLMRRHKVTIRGLAKRMNVTMKAIRKARNEGLRGPAVLDYQEGVLGEFTPRLRACLKYWRREVRGSRAA